MAVPLLAPDAPGRVSQALPVVKCSNCTLPVPLNQLSHHVCPSFPGPASTPPPALLHRPPPPPFRAPPNDAKHLRIATPPAPDRLKINTAFAPPQRSSPLAERNNAAFPQLPSPTNGPLSRRPPPPRPRAFSNASDASSPAPHQSPLRPPPPLSPDPRYRASSNASPTHRNDSFSPAPYARVPSRSATTPVPGSLPPGTSSSPNTPSRRQPYDANPRFDARTPLPADPIPFLPERDIDTKTGGEAGMAGVGRRGFAAAARAAMLASSVNRPRDQDGPSMYLDINLPPRLAIETPPLSAGSGYSSSPNLSPFPHSPTGPPQPRSPDRYGSKPSSLQESPASANNPSGIMNTHTSPTSRTKPYLRNDAPATHDFESLPPHISTKIETPSTAKQPSPRSPARESESLYSASIYSMALFGRSDSTSTTTSRNKKDRARRPLTPPSESDSDLGLAYADSTTDTEDGQDAVKTRKVNPPPPLPLNSILRSDSTVTTGHIRFPSDSDRSDRSAIRIFPPGTAHKRDASISSASSAGSNHAAVIAQALGLSQRPPTEYGRLGGPGTGRGGGRLGRSGSGSSSSGKSAYSRRGSEGTTGVGLGSMEKETETLLEDVAAGSLPGEDRRRGLSKSKSAGKQRTFEASEDGSASEDATKSSGVGKTGAHRSNTVQGVPASEPKSPKMPIRARTSTARSADVKEGKVKKERVCLKCRTMIENGRWVRVDSGNGGVLCENCWKNMYLPKCRRCNLPIEKQAVSSSDGQLKGKYHRECFNCHVCHKPFPDKSFYVFDGRPLCAYHYHEANNSLCAAARCGQPIEGPCAVSHAGDRYHPEHMTCEHPGDPPCRVRLEEYWEVDGRMLCERHARGRKNSYGEDEDEGQWMQSSKARKRVTRFIDLSELH